MIEIFTRILERSELSKNIMDFEQGPPYICLYSNFLRHVVCEFENRILEIVQISTNVAISENLFVDNLSREPLIHSSDIVLWFILHGRCKQILI